MRTKILLTAVAALAAGLVSSNAQVTSANIVGYVSYVSQTNAPGYEAIDTPLDSGSNTIKNLFPSAPGGSQILQWTGTSYNTYIYSTALGGHWKLGPSTADTTLLPVGSGYLIQVAGSGKYTNTFVGTVVPQTGVISNVTVAAGLQLVSSLVPYGDYVTNRATLNITNVAGGTQILKYNVANQSYDTYIYSTALGGHWKLGPGNVTPVINVGEGFFFNAASPYTWVETGP